MLPIVLLVGEAGSGKDTVANMLSEYGGVSVALANPVKVIAEYLFRFTKDQLWGSSELRDIPDSRFLKGEGQVAWDQVFDAMKTSDFIALLRNTFPQSFSIDSINHLSLCLAVLRRDNVDSDLTPRRVLQVLGTEWGRAYKESLWIDTCTSNCFKLLSRESTKFVVVSDGRFLNEVLGFAKLGAKIWKINSKSSSRNDTHISETGISKISPYYFDSIINNDREQGLEALKIKVMNEIIGMRNG